MESKQRNESLIDESWILEMKEDLDKFEKTQVWTFTERPKNFSVIVTKWVF